MILRLWRVGDFDQDSPRNWPIFDLNSPDCDLQGSGTRILWLQAIAEETFTFFLNQCPLEPIVKVIVRMWVEGSVYLFFSWKCHLFKECFCAVMPGSRLDPRISGYFALRTLCGALNLRLSNLSSLLVKLGSRLIPLPSLHKKTRLTTTPERLRRED